MLLTLGVALFLFRPDPAVRSLLLRGIRIENSLDTPFGNITTGLYGDDRTVYYDHRPLWFSGDVITTEENIHYALLQREGYGKVLLISGGLGKHLPEIMKHKVSELTYLEMDPGLIAAEGVRDTICGSMTVRVVRVDPVTFMKDDGGTYDAVIQLIPPPSTLSVNRFYTVEYFRAVREQLSPDGIFLCTPMPWFNYSPESYRRGLSPLYNALSAVFSHVTIIPGSLLYALASGEPVSASVAHLAGARDIASTYVNSDYLNDSEIKAKAEQILAQVDRKAGVNTVMRPVTSLFANLLSLERMGMRGGIIFLLSILIIIPFAFLSRGGPVMFASSAGLAGFGMIMIFLLQMTVGNIYILSAVILTLLMGGLATGAAFGGRIALKSLNICVLLLTSLFTLTGLLAPSLSASSPGPVLVFILVVMPVTGVVTGAVYRLLTARGEGMITGRVYAADLAGSALGYLTAATILVPLAGIANACFVLAGFILISGFIASVTGKM
jgi:spermidine synthase